MVILSICSGRKRLSADRKLFDGDVLVFWVPLFNSFHYHFFGVTFDCSLCHTLSGISFFVWILLLLYVFPQPVSLLPWLFFPAVRIEYSA